jgi:hypothetical protein
VAIRPMRGAGLTPKAESPKDSGLRPALGLSDLGMVAGLLVLAVGVSLAFGYAWALMLVGLLVLVGSYLAGRS